MRPDLKGVRPLTMTEVKHRRHLRDQGKTPPPRPKPRKKNKVSKIKHRKVVYSVCLRPELKSRAEWEVGQGNFSLAVERALTQALIEVDRARNYSETKDR